MGDYPYFSPEMVNARVIGLTLPTDELPDAEGVSDLITYCARISNKENRNNYLTGERLLKYCRRNAHWSVFEMANAVIEVACPRDISRQILRHRSFSFQELSGRYSEMDEGFVLREPRTPHPTNRQASEDMDRGSDAARMWGAVQITLLKRCIREYKDALDYGIAKEVARCILPEGNTMSRVCINGTLRSWLHYLDVRLDEGTQKEHRWVAEQASRALALRIPEVFNRE